MVTAAQALECVDLRRRADVHVALRAALVSRREDLALFDHAFGLFFREGEPASRAESPVDHPTAASPRSPELDTPAEERTPGLRAPDWTRSRVEPGPDGPPAETVLAATYSTVEVLRHKDFEKMTPAEVEATRRLMQALAVAVARRRSRRLRRSATGHQLDLRRLMRLNLREGGEMVRLAWRGPKWKRRPLVLLCDISGSMERYSRLLLHFVHAVKSAVDDVEAFVFATRLTRITRHLRTHDVDAAVAAVSAAVQDWASGTRIGEALRDFNRLWGRRVLGQGALVVIISDGWDRGQVEVLREEMARLQRACFRLVWMNPLLGQPDYQPLTVGMEAALPYVDDFMSAHNLSSLEALAALLGEEDRRRPVRRQRLALVS
jgi:uncharacterized protein with von Willebrand factor type A (vWA) domain